MTVMRLQQLVNSDQLRTARTLHELIAWMSQVADAVDDLPSRSLYRRGRIDDASPYNRFMKVYREEVWPVRNFAERTIESGTAKISFPAVSTDADAWIVDWPYAGARTPIEVTCAVEEYVESLRMELLTKEGNAPAFGPIERVKKTREIKADHEMIEKTELMERICGLIGTTITKKAARQYPHGTWLVVQFDDMVGFANKHLSPCENYLPVVRTGAVSAAESTFERIYLVGTHERGYCCRVL